MAIEVRNVLDLSLLPLSLVPSLSSICLHPNSSDPFASGRGKRCGSRRRATYPQGATMWSFNNLSSTSTSAFSQVFFYNKKDLQHICLTEIWLI
jgi:hypothetical protein